MVKRRIDDAVAKGRVGCSPAAGLTGPSVQPTLLGRRAVDDAELAQHETFGPVAVIEVVPDADTAVRRANETRLRAGGRLSSRPTPDRGLALAGRIDAGIVHVNDQTVGDEPQMPFGGVKDSGWGRFGGAFAMDEFTELRWVTVQSGSRQFPF